MTLQIALIVTGDLEREGLARSLHRVFPEVEFTVDSKRDSFTSGRVRILEATGIRSLVDKLAAALVAAVDPGRDAAHLPDRVIVVEDLELANLEQPEVVVNAFRRAVLRHVDDHWPSEARRQRARLRLRERASFHLLAPMPEAYFFSEAAQLVAAGAKPTAALAAGHDLEDFTVVDAGYLETPDGSLSWARPDRARHPKRYLQYLLDPTEKTVKYRETKQGVAALDATNWWRIQSLHAPDHLRFLRSLLADIAMGLDPPAEWVSGRPHPATWHQQPGQVLRNV